MSGLRRARAWLGYTVLLAVVAVIDFPVGIVFLNAVKPRDDIVSHRLLPGHFTLDNLRALGNEPFGRFMLNSLITAGGGTLLAVVAAAFGGYALSRFRRRAVNGYSRLLLAVQTVPIIVTLLPLFVVFKTLHLIDSYAGLILLYGAMLLPFATWVLRSFFDGIPVELEESAWVDGCGRVRALVRVVVPLAGPGLAGVTVLCFVTAWNEYLLASVFLRSQNLLTVGVGLQLFSQQLLSNWGPVMAGAAVAMLPSLAVYLAFQRYFVSGILAGAIEG